MIIIKCDICGKEYNKINTLILLKRKIDYCNNKLCKEKIQIFKEELEDKLMKNKNILYDIMKREQDELLDKIIQK